MRRAIPCVSVVVVSTLLALGAVSAAEVPEGFRLEPVFTGLTEPSSLDHLPDGGILITERTTGNVREVRGGELMTSPVCTVTVFSGGDRGLLGIAVHPDFESNGWIYLYYTADVSGSPRNKVTRYALGPSGCESPLDILPDLGSSASGANLGGGIAFGPDDKLYVAVGDMEDSSNGQNDSTLPAKILRVNDNGSVPSDNPTPGSLVYTKGVRDPRGLAVNEAGQVYADDADAASPGDELNAAVAGGNLGWVTCTSASCEAPLVTWDPVIGVGGLSVYGANAFPDLTSDGLDNDHDKWGPDQYPGVFRTDDDGDGVCVGSNNNENTCTSNADCPPRVVIFTEDAYCEFQDEADEWCPSGVPYGDDGCDASAVNGVDEADESFVDNLFLAADGEIVRTVLQGANLDQLFDSTTFVDSTFLSDCPTDWADVMTGRDGFLYAVATNGGGSGNGGLYRVVSDDEPGPREVSGEGSHFPLRLEKGAVADDLDLYWEDLRTDATQPREIMNRCVGTNPPVSCTTNENCVGIGTGVCDGVPAAPEREYTVWQGTLGSWDSHAPVSGLDPTPGTAVNDALRKATVTTAPGDDLYFLVSATHANLEGTLGKRESGERPGPAVTDLCDTIGYHESPSYNTWWCGQDFTLRDEHGETHDFHEYREQVIVLDLSAIWCGPCRAEADVLENLHQDYKDRGVRVLTVLMDDNFQLVDFTGRPTPEDCRNWADRADPNPDHTFPCWVDSNPESGPQQAWPKYNKYGAVPTNVVLDRGLRVVLSDSGYDETSIRNTLDRLVGTDTCLP